MDTRWKKSGALTDRRAISPLIATLILILIAVVGGGMVYIVFSNQAKSLSTTTDIQVQSASISNANGIVVASVTVKNTGTTTIGKITVKVYGGNGSPCNLTPIVTLKPGGTGGSTEQIAGTYEINKSYVIEFAAYDAENDHVVATRSLTVNVSG